MAEKLVFIQETFLDSIKKEHEQFNLLPEKDKNEYKLKSFLKTLENDFNDSRKYHATLLKISEDENQEEIVKSYMEEGTMSRIRKHYHNYWADLSFQINSKENPILTSTMNPITSICNEERKPYKLKLPTLDIKQFTGIYEEWTGFFNLFESSIDKVSNLDNVEKLQYLKQSVSGEAHDMIKHLSITNDNYQVAKDILIDQYDHKRKIAHGYVKKLLDYQPLKTECAKELRNLLSTIKDCMASLKQLQLPVEEWDFLLLCILQQKLPSNTYRDWERKLGGSRAIPKFQDFLRFIEETFRMLEMVEPPQKIGTVNRNKTFHLQTDGNKTSSKFKKTKKRKCLLCKADHGIAKCQKFLSADFKQRCEIQKTNKLCMNCLGVNHSAEKCFSFKSCIYCAKGLNRTARHHSLLHDHSVEVDTVQESTNNLTRSYHTFNNSGVQTAALLATAQVRIVNNSGFAVTLRALIDPCSEDNYITNNSCRLLSLPKYENPCSVSGIGDSPIAKILYRTLFDIQSIDGKFRTTVDAAVTKKISQLIPSEQIPSSACGFFNNLSLADPNYNFPGEVHLLLGVGVYAEIVQQGVKKFGACIYGQNTSLGWIIGGQTEKQTDRPKHHALFMTKINKDDALNNQIKKFWEVEEVPFEIPIKPEDKFCEEKFLSTVNQKTDRRLIVELPFRHMDQPILGPSKEIALKRFLNLEKRLDADPILKAEYHKIIHEYLGFGHMIAVTTNIPDGKEYFLPHHAVLKESSTTTKVRIVFDASCKSGDGMSLNDHLMTGPKLQNDIRDIIFNWRKFKFAYTADIARMYRIFWLNEKHQNYQKILWRFDQSEPVREYQLTTVTFGVNCAPYLAIRALHYIADINISRPNLSAVCKSLKSEFYVDDFLSGDHSIQDANQKQTLLRELLTEYGLQLRKWCSNESKILEGVPLEHQELKTELKFDETDFRKTLGIYWTPINDYFKFSIDKECYNVNQLTKRKALSLISRLYDPMGWASPCTMFAKVLMQEIWKSKIGWDDEVGEPIKRQFITFFKELYCLEDVAIPRWINLVDECSPVTLLGFCDASWKGYGAVIYLKINKTDNTNHETYDLILLASKTKVSPINFSSIPRLELCGALLLSELMKWAVKLLQPRNVKVRAFSDSQVVLHWLRSHPSKWKPYVASRTSKILENIPADLWFYVHTSKNPADLASKGVLPSELVNNNLWWQGPNLENVSEAECLLTSEEHEIIDKEKKVVVHNFQTKKASNSLQFLTNYSSHFKLCYQVTLCCKFISKVMNKVIKRISEFKNKFQFIMQRLENSEVLIVRLVQNEVFHDDMKCLIKRKPLSSKSQIASLDPFVDGFGVLRVGGRLQNSSLSYNQKHPMILPSVHHITNNIIRNAHELLLHGPENLTLSYLRNKFHILRASDRVRFLINKCIICIRYAKDRHEQIMGSLPEDRVATNRPFLNTGVDYAGPILTKEKGRGKKIHKSYIALFICMSTKAMHLEVVSDLSSQAFLAAFRRFVNRRGYCQTLYSDNGTNFVGSKKILDMEIKQAELQWRGDLQLDFDRMKTEWLFNPASAPHFGGLWEAGIKSVKTQMVKTIGNKTLTFEELYTVLVQIEGILNSRPMCSVSNDPNSYIALTPAHFILGEALVTPPEPVRDSDSKTPVDRWIHLQTVRQQFWKSYVSDYLNRLQRRPKWLKTKTVFDLNDLVLVKDSNLSPTVWPLAKIIELHPGRDGVVRVVTLKNASGRVFKRPTVKLRRLPINELTN